MGSEEKALKQILLSELEEYKKIGLNLSKRLEEALDTIDMMVNLHRETCDDLDRCCNIFEILLNVETEIDSDITLEGLR